MRAHLIVSLNSKYSDQGDTFVGGCIGFPKMAPVCATFNEGLLWNIFFLYLLQCSWELLLTWSGFLLVPITN
jgi:hypothetical protein